MNKETFLRELEKQLGQLKPEERKRQTGYYSELLDDMMEDGLSEAAAVEKLGDSRELAAEILRQQPLSELMKSRVKPKNGWTVLTVSLLILGSPVWLSLLLAFFFVILTVYICLWAVVIAFFSVVLALAAGAAALLVVCFMNLTGFPFALMCAGGFAAAAGLTILGFIGAVYCARGIVRLSAAIGRWVKSFFIKKEDC